MALRVYANQLWNLGQVPRVWLIRWDGCLQAAGNAWHALPPADQDAWYAYCREISYWPAWNRDVDTLALNARARPFPQAYGATAIWCKALGEPPPTTAPTPHQVPHGDQVALVTSPTPAPPPGPLSAHVWATWTAPGGWGGSTIDCAVFSRSRLPATVSNKYWRWNGIGFVRDVRPGVPFLLDDALLAGGASGSSIESWITIVLVERGIVPFVVTRQIRRSWFI